MSNRRVRKSVLRWIAVRATLLPMAEEPVVEREDVNAILRALFDITYLLTVLVLNTGGFGDEEEEEA